MLSGTTSSSTWLGPHGLAALRRLLVPSGVLVLSSGGGGRWFGPTGRILRAAATSPFVGARLRPFTARRNRDDLIELARMVDAGSIRPAIEATYPLESVPDVLRRIEAGDHPRAKIAIAVS